MAAKIVLPGYQERLLFIGTNGTGKSILASGMLEHYPRVIVVDLKGDFIPPWKDAKILTKPPMNGKREREWAQNHIIYRPDPMYIDGVYPALFLKWCFYKAKKQGKRVPFILYVDEGLYMSSTSAKTWLRNLAILTRSMGLGLWVTLQRPRNAPVEVRSEAWQWYIFYETYDEDLKEIAAYSGGQLTYKDLQQMADYSFYLMKRVPGGRIQVTHYPPLKMPKTTKLQIVQPAVATR